MKCKIRQDLGERKYKELYDEALLWSHIETRRNYPIIKDYEMLMDANEFFSAKAFKRLATNVVKETCKRLNATLQNPFKLKVDNTSRLFLSPISESSKRNNKGYEIKLIKWTPDWCAITRS